MESQFKVVLVGDPITGKSTFLKKLATGVYDKKYSPTINVAVRELRFSTNEGEVILNVWDTAGQPKLTGLGDRYYINADAGIIFYDLTSKSSIKSIERYKKALLKICPGIPIAIVGNKYEHKDLKPKIRVQKAQEAFRISVKKNVNLNNPLLWLIRALTKSEDLVFEEQKHLVNKEQKERESN